MLSDRDYMRPSGPGRPWQRPSGSVIKPLIWANVIVFLFTGFGRSSPGDVNNFFELLHLHPYYLHKGEVWRLGTYMFAHGGFAHLFFNMWGLYLFGQIVEDRLGPQRFLRLYFISGVLGGLAWLLTCWNAPGLYDVVAGGQTLEEVSSPARLLANPTVSVLHAYGGVVGASGAIFGVMMAAAMTAPNLRILLLLPPVPMKLKTFVALYALIEIVMAWTTATGHMGSNIAHLAHLGGLAGAFLYMKHLGHRSPWDACRNLVDDWRGRRTRRHFQKIMGGPSAGVGPAAAEVDRILDKIGHEGMQSLTEAERQTLKDAGRRFRESRDR